MTKAIKPCPACLRRYIRVEEQWCERCAKIKNEAALQLVEARRRMAAEANTTDTPEVGS
jgi:reverse gyrase